MSSSPVDGPSTNPIHIDRGRSQARYSCAICGRHFDRRDTLARHSKIHTKRHHLPKPRRKACLPCSRAKIRCECERPSCSSCIKRNVACTYSAARTREGQSPSDPTGVSVQPAALQEPLSPGRSQSIDLMTVPDDGSTSQVYSLLDQVQSPVRNDTNQFPEDVPPQNFFGPLDMRDHGGFSSNLEWVFDFNDHDLNVPLMDELPAMGHMQIPLANPTQLLHSLPISSGGSNTNSKSDKDSWIQGNLPTPELRDVPPPDDPWPMELRARPLQHVVLPALGEAAGTHRTLNHFSTREVCLSVHNALQKCIQLPSEQSPWQPIIIESFPSKDTVDHCIDMYFVHFHQQFPIIHRPTFDPGESLIVTLAMVTIGACYSDLEGNEAFAIAVSELNRRLLLFMSEYDRRFVRTEPLLTAQLLQALHGYGSGNERLFELSESCRSSVVYHAKYMGLFRDPEPQPPASDSLEGTWKEWIRQERHRRLGWAVYEYDTCISLLQNDRPLLHIADARMTLPCSMKHWDAESAYAWSTLQPMMNFPPTGPRLQPIIKSLLDGNQRVAETLSNERHRIVILLSLSRMMWSLKEVTMSPMGDLIGNNLEDVRQKIQDTIDCFWQYPVSLSHTHTRTEVARSVHAMHIVHLAHIYGAGTLMNIYYPFLRNYLLQKTEEGSVAQDHMRQWATENPRRTRGVAFHCAQILALARQFPENMSMEPFLVFHAGVLLMTMGLVMPAAQQSRPGLRIDHLGSAEDATSVRISSWVRDGGDEIIGVHGVPVLCCETGCKQVLDETAEVLKQLKVWKLTHALLRVVLAIRDRL